MKSGLMAGKFEKGGQRQDDDQAAAVVYPGSGSDDERVHHSGARNRDETADEKLLGQIHLLFGLNLIEFVGIAQMHEQSKCRQPQNGGDRHQNGWRTWNRLPRRPFRR